jgi:hypothetical protein
MTDLSHYLRPQARFPALLPLLSLVLLSVAFYGALRGYEMQGRTAVMQQKSETLRAAAAKAPPPQLSKADVETQKRWTALRAERDFSWGPLFAAVEHAGNEDIELLGFEPDKVNRKVVFRGEARDALAVVEFLERLASQKVLKEVHLAHQKKMVRGRINPIAFEIKAGIAP